MSEASDAFEPVQLTPAGWEMLNCSFVVPQGWIRPEIPVDEADLKDPTTFMALFISMASYGAVLFTVAARPAFDSGTVRDWAEYLAKHHGLELQRFTPVKLGDCPALQVDATQPSEAGVMRVRSIFLEDGARLFNLGAMAPEQIWPSVEGILQRCLESFRLAEVKGQTVPIAPPTFDEKPEEPIEHPKPGDISIPISTEDPRDGANSANPEEDGEDADAKLYSRSTVETPRIENDNPHANLNPAPANTGRPTQAKDVALADDASSLDPEHPMNARMRDNGVGLVPKVIMTATREKFASIGAGAIEQIFRVPFGWHVIDDGRRTLVFDAGGKMQINLDLRPGAPGEEPRLFHEIISGLLEAHGDFKYFDFEATGIKGIGVQNLNVNGEVLQQGYLIKDVGHEGRLLVCRVTSDAEHMTFAMNAAEVMLTSMQPPAPPDTSNPAWWQKALELEAKGQLKEAEQAILTALDHLGAYSQVAELYEQRAARLTQAGQHAEAKEALLESCNWMDDMASLATSGGEGAALSLQAKEHRKRLGL